MSLQVVQTTLNTVWQLAHTNNLSISSRKKSHSYTHQLFTSLSTNVLHFLVALFKGNFKILGYWIYQWAMPPRLKMSEYSKIQSIYLA